MADEHLSKEHINALIQIIHSNNSLDDKLRAGGKLIEEYRNFLDIFALLDMAFDKELPEELKACAAYTANMITPIAINEYTKNNFYEKIYQIAISPIIEQQNKIAAGIVYFQYNFNIFVKANVDDKDKINLALANLERINGDDKIDKQVKDNLYNFISYYFTINVTKARYAKSTKNRPDISEMNAKYELLLEVLKLSKQDVEKRMIIAKNNAG